MRCFLIGWDGFLSGRITMKYSTSTATCVISSKGLLFHHYSIFTADVFVYNYYTLLLICINAIIKLINNFTTINDLFHSNNPAILGENNANLPRIVLIIAESLVKDSINAEDEVYGRLLNIVAQLQVSTITRHCSTSCSDDSGGGVSMMKYILALCSYIEHSCVRCGFADNTPFCFTSRVDLKIKPEKHHFIIFIYLCMYVIYVYYKYMYICYLYTINML